MMIALFDQSIQVDYVFYRTVTYSGPIVSTSSVVRMGQRHSTHDRKWNGAAACVQLYSVYMSYGEISKVAALCNPECNKDK